MTDTLRAQLQTTLGTAYTIERELGGGGMSRVFRNGIGFDPAKLIESVRGKVGIF